MKKYFWIFLILATLFAAVFYAWLERRRSLKRGALQPPPAGQILKADEASWRMAKELARSTKGFIVWSSNRSGNHEIYLMSLPDLNVKMLTQHPHVDSYPRISPDGKQVAFARSQQPWVSQRNNELWDVYLLDLKSGRERLLAKDGTAPMWLSNDRITFHRKNVQVVEFSISDKKERVLFESGRQNIPEKTVLLWPVYSPAADTLGVTLRGTTRKTALITQAGNLRKMAGGCQVNWSPDSSYIYYVDHGGKGKNAFYKVDPQSLARTLWFDSPGDYSHEYFPRLSQDNAWLVYGACAEGHEHDTADYEIFLWKVGTPFEQAVRLTYHTGNDCWPDIFIENN